MSFLFAKFIVPYRGDAQAVNAGGETLRPKGPRRGHPRVLRNAPFACIRKRRAISGTPLAFSSAHERDVDRQVPAGLLGGRRRDAARGAAQAVDAGGEALRSKGPRRGHPRVLRNAPFVCTESGVPFLARRFSLSKKVTGRWPFFSLEILELRERMRYNSEG